MCETEFCVGCNQEDRPPISIGWLTASVLEADLVACPVCTGAIEDQDKVGVIVSSAELGA
jgi:hypothetical protein